MDKITLQLKKLPKLPGVYLFADKAGRVIYVGKAISLAERVKSYFKKNSLSNRKIAKMVGQIASISFIPVQSEIEALLLEARLIWEKQPVFNTMLKDDKSFLYILITDEEYPRVVLARKSDGLKGIHFGPFPKTATARQVLKFLRRIFPFSTHKIGRSVCFYSHLGLCQPCPSEIQKLPTSKQKAARKIYLTNIRYLKNVLQGKTRKVIADLEKEMQREATEENFEKAKFLRDQIEKLKYTTLPRTKIVSYLENPNFLENLSGQEISDLKKVLSPFFPNLNLERIECFDISNLFARDATGSMVVFTEGIQEKNEYRRFRIRRKGRPNDVAMLQEVIRRRLTHSEWSLPGLLIVDGGKGQVHGALSVLEESGILIPIVGLAKRLEEIVIPQGKSFQILRLLADSPALNLLKRVRDESHRFAIAYHQKIRKKRSFEAI